MADEPRDRESGSGGVRTAPFIRPTEADTSLFGSLLRGRFRVERRLGAGGQAKVYLAHDQRLGREVAIKRSRHSWLLSHEGEIQSALEHSNIATVFDLVGSGSECFLVEEFVRGTTLRESIREPLPRAEFLRIGRGCLAGLAAASRHDIVHCDIKPDNIMLTADGRPKILDFGLARRADRPPNDPGSATAYGERDSHPRGGTPGYMAPEAINDGALTPRTDVFSLGIVFYEMLTGKHPFRKGTRIATDASTLLDTPPSPHTVDSHVPVALSRVVMRMLAKKPDERLTAAEALREIETWQRHHDSWRSLLIYGLPALGAATAAALLAFWAIREVPVSPPDFVTLGEFRADGSPRLEAFAAGFREEVRDRLADVPGLQIVDPAAGFVTDLAVTAVVSDQPVGEPYSDRSRLSIDYEVRESGERVYWRSNVQERISGLNRAVEEVAAGIAHSLEQKYGLAGLPLGGTPPTASPAVFARYVEARGRQALGGADLAGAVPLLESVVNEAPAFPQARIRLAEVLWARSGDDDDPAAARRAEEVALAAVGAAEDVPAASLVLGDILLGTGREREALARYRRAIALDVNAWDPYLRLATALEANDRPDEARTALEEAIAAGPADWRRHDRLGVHLYRQGELEGAVQSFEEAARLAPGNPRLQAKLGAMFGLLGEREQAEQAYRRSVAIRPDYVAYTNWGTLLRNAGEAERAAALYEEAVREVPDEYLLWAALASAYDLLPGRREDAARAARRAIELGEEEARTEEGDADLLVRLAQLYETVGDSDAADGALEGALRIAPGDAGILLNAALVLEGRGERGRALELVERALQAGCLPAWVEDEPGLADLAADPAYAEMVRELEPGD